MSRKPGKPFIQQLKTALVPVHRWLGLASGLIVFIVAITGCIYVFEEEGRNLIQSRYFHVEVPQTGDKQPLTALTSMVQAAYPKETITQLRFEEAEDATVIFHTKGKLAISVNPYTAEVTGVRNMETDFYSWILVMHRTLHLGETGKLIIKVNVLIFFVMCVSGLVLWWPRQKKFFKQAIRIKFNTNNWKRLNWDLHSVLGFYAVAVLIIISMTGMFWTYDIVKKSVSLATGAPIGKSKAPENVSGHSLEQYPVELAYMKARLAHPGANLVMINYPGEEKQPIRVLFRYPFTIVRNQDIMYYDSHTGNLLREELFKNYTAYEKYARANYTIHTGNFPLLGIGSKIIYFIAGLFAASLPVTGFLMWYGKRKKAARKTEPSFGNASIPTPKRHPVAVSTLTS